MNKYIVYLYLNSEWLESHCTVREVRDFVKSSDEVELEYYVGGLDYNIFLYVKAKSENAVKDVIVRALAKYDSKLPPNGKSAIDLLSVLLADNEQDLSIYSSLQLTYDYDSSEFAVHFIPQILCEVFGEVKVLCIGEDSAFFLFPRTATEEEFEKKCDDFHALIDCDDRFYYNVIWGIEEWGFSYNAEKWSNEAEGYFFFHRYSQFVAYETNDDFLPS